MNAKRTLLCIAAVTLAWQVGARAQVDVRDIESKNDVLMIEATFAHHTPEQLFACWTEPRLLARWWCQQAEVEAKVGGKYVLSWPMANRVVKGTITKLAAGKVLEFTWEEAGRPPLVTMTVTFRAGPDGTVLRVERHPYADNPAGQAERAAHAKAWKMFFKILDNVKP